MAFVADCAANTAFALSSQSFADEQEREEELERVRQMREVAAYHRERDFEVRMVETLEVRDPF